MTSLLRAAIATVTLALAACSEPREMQTLRGETMGTTWSVKLVTPVASDGRSLQDAIQQRLDTVVAQMSTWEPDSDLSRYNQAAAGTWIHLKPEFATVLTRALALARDSGGAYDPTVGPLVNLWGFGPDRARNEPPSADAIAAMKARIGWQRIVFDAAHARLQQPGGLYLDLSSVAKGFAVDDVSDYLLAQGHADSLVEVGGELRGRGHKPDGSDWNVAIERPGSGAEEAVIGANGIADGDASAVLAIGDRALATSGDYRHVFEKDGQFYSHHIDPRSGYPVPHALASVSVIAATCLEADPLGTTLTVLGPDEGLRWATERGIAALFVLRTSTGYEQRMTPAFAAAVAQ